MNKDLIINASSAGLEVALLEDGQLTELHHNSKDVNFAVGDVFVGRVKRTVEGHNAAFVDIGYERDAFLHYSDLSPQVLSVKKYTKQALVGQHSTGLLHKFELEPNIDKHGKIGDVLQRRDLVLVQVVKEPISSKGPRISCEITLAGRYCVLAPFSDTVSISRKIRIEEERIRLKRLAESIKPQKFGIIVRTAAENRKVAEIHEDIQQLLSRWKTLTRNLNNAQPTAKVLSEISKTTGLLRDMLNKSLNSVVVNDKSLYGNIKEYIETLQPEAQKMVSHYNGRTPIFDQYKVTRQIKAAFGKTITMPSGAYIILEHTEAMHVIDVNSGHKQANQTTQANNAITVNLEAAQEIARQLRLRDIGGLIVIDFIDMKDAEHRKMLHRRMTEAMSTDKAKHTILPLSKFCLMQITRERVRPELKISTAENCPTCRGTGKVKATILLIHEIESQLGYLLVEMGYSNIRLVVHPFVEAYIKKGIISKQWSWFWRYKKWTSVEKNNNFHLTQYRFYKNQTEEIRL